MRRLALCGALFSPASSGCPRGLPKARIKTPKHTKQEQQQSISGASPAARPPLNSPKIRSHSSQTTALPAVRLVRRWREGRHVKERLVCSTVFAREQWLPERSSKSPYRNAQAYQARKQQSISGTCPWLPAPEIPKMWFQPNRTTTLPTGRLVVR